MFSETFYYVLYEAFFRMAEKIIFRGAHLMIKQKKVLVRQCRVLFGVCGTNGMPAP